MWSLRGCLHSFANTTKLNFSHCKQNYTSQYEHVGAVQTQSKIRFFAGGYVSKYCAEKTYLMVFSVGGQEVFDWRKT